MFKIRANLSKIFKNKAVGKLKEKIDKVGGTRLTEVSKYLYITEQTQMFQASQTVIRSSDFIAKFALYKYLTEVKKEGHDSAWITMQETFVNYNVPLNRYLQWGNSVGIFLFLKYFMAIQRAVVKLFIKKPATSLMALAGHNLLGVNFPSIFDSSVFTGNLFPQFMQYDNIVKEAVVPPGVDLAMLNF